MAPSRPSSGGGQAESGVPVTAPGRCGLSGHFEAASSMPSGAPNPRRRHPSARHPQHTPSAAHRAGQGRTAAIEGSEPLTRPSTAAQSCS